MSNTIRPRVPTTPMQHHRHPSPTQHLPRHHIPLPRRHHHHIRPPQHPEHITHPLHPPTSPPPHPRRRRLHTRTRTPHQQRRHRPLAQPFESAQRIDEIAVPRRPHEEHDTSRSSAKMPASGRIRDRMSGRLVSAGHRGQPVMVQVGAGACWVGCPVRGVRFDGSGCPRTSCGRRVTSWERRRWSSDARPARTSASVWSEHVAPVRRRRRPFRQPDSSGVSHRSSPGRMPRSMTTSAASEIMPCHRGRTGALGRRWGGSPTAPRFGRTARRGRPGRCRWGSPGDTSR